MPTLFSRISMSLLPVLLCSGVSNDSKGFAASRVLPPVTPPMLSPEYWLKGLPEAEALLLDNEGIAAFNQQTQAAMGQTIYDLLAYPPYLDHPTLQSFLTAASFPAETVYQNDQPVDPAFYVYLGARRNLAALRAANLVRCGLTITRTSMRTFPTAAALFSTPDDREFDLWQETALSPAEPVLILHQSSDSAWYFIQTHNFRGWVPAVTVALTPREVWETTLLTADILVVVAADLRLPLSGADPKADHLLFEMGARIPLATTEVNEGNYTVKLPRRGPGGQLEWLTAYVPQTTGVSRSFLPYTQANILRQAFRVLGRPYGWGGMHDTIDCSAFIYNIFRTFGLQLPRNADQQECAAGKTIDLAVAGKDQPSRLASLPPGSTLHLKGHVMLYLGAKNGYFYAIHALAAYGDKRYPDGEGGYRRVPVMEVLVSDLTLTRVNGLRLIDSLTVAKTFE